RRVAPRDWLVMRMLSLLQRLLIMAALLLAAAPARAEVAAAPFDGSLQRLPEVLRPPPYPRRLRRPHQRQEGRHPMHAVVDAEAPGGDRRARMIAAFNRGYRGFAQSYRTCTPAADLVIRRYLEEGSKIAREMTARYAN